MMANEIWSVFVDSDSTKRKKKKEISSLSLSQYLHLLTLKTETGIKMASMW